MRKEIAVSEARTHLAEIIESTTKDHTPIYLTKRGKPVAAIIDFEDLERILKNSEDYEDLLDAQKAYNEMIEAKEIPIPWEEVKKDLGLT